MAENQKEEEFFAVTATGRKGLDEMTDKMGSEIMAIAARDVQEAGATWIKRAVVSITNNDGLRDVLATKAGLFSVYKALAKAATMGLQIGGQFPHAHLTPYNGKVELIVSAEGYRHAAIHGPGAVLSDCAFRRVYEGEDFSIDFSGASVKHSYDGSKPRGKLLGVYGSITRKDGAAAVDYMTVLEAEQIRDWHSVAWKKGLGPWKTDHDAMVEKTAAKKFLRKYAAEAEGLAMLYARDVDDEPESYEPPPRNVSDRMSAHLERRAEKVEAMPAKNEEPETEGKPDVEPSSEPGDLF